MYLRNKDRETLIFIASIVGYLNQDLSKTFLKDEEISIAKEGYEKLLSVIDLVNKRMNQDFIKELINDIKQSEIVVIPKSDANKLKHTREEFKIEVLNKDFVGLVENTIELKCKNCVIKNYKSCDYRRLFLRLSVDVYDVEAVSVCPYKY